jgi:hypothetical protein
VPRILDNISLDLVSALKNTLAGSRSADISVGYFNLRGWRLLNAQIEHPRATMTSKPPMLEFC